MSLWLPCGLLSRAEPITVTVTVIVNQCVFGSVRVEVVVVVMVVGNSLKQV